MRRLPLAIAVITPLAGAAAASLVAEGVRRVARLTGEGATPGAPALVAIASSVAVSAALCGWISRRAARAGGSHGRGVPAALGLAALAAAIAGFLVPASTARAAWLWSTIQREEGSLAAFLLDAGAVAIAVAIPVAALSLLASVEPAPSSSRTIGLLLLGAAVAAALGVPSPGGGALAAVVLLAVCPALWYTASSRALPTAATRLSQASLVDPTISGSPRPPRPRALTRAPLVAILLALSGASGAVALAGLERLARLAIGTAPASGTACAIAGLAASGFGALMAPRALRRAAGPWRLLGACLALAGSSALFAAIVADMLPHAFLGVLARAGGADRGEAAARMTVAAIVFLAPCLFAGASLGVAASIFGGAIPLAAGGAGVAIGAAWPGIVIPSLGLEGAVALSATLLAVAGGLAVFLEQGSGWGRSMRALTLLLVCAALLWGLDPWDRRLLSAGIAENPALYLEDGESRLAERVSHDRILMYADGSASTVAIKLVEGKLPVLFVDGAVIPLAGFEDRRGQFLAGSLPALLGPDRGRALVLASGAPATLEALGRFRGLTIDVAAGDAAAARFALEAPALASGPLASPASADASPSGGAVGTGFGAAPTPHAPASPGASRSAPRFLPGDAVRALARDADGYDLVTSPPLSRERDLLEIFDPHTLALIREHLRPGGVVCLPLPLRRLSAEGMDVARRLFGRVFADASAWSAGSELFLVGGAGASKIPLERIALRMREGEIADDLRALGIEDSARLVSLRLFTLAPEPLPQAAGGARDEGAAFAAAAAAGTMETHAAENLRSLAARLEPPDASIVFPDSWSPEAREALGRRLGVLLEVRRRVLEARAALASGDAPLSLRRADAALDFDTSDQAARSIAARALCLSAEAALAHGQRGVAAESYERALDADPQSVEALTALSWIRHEQGRDDIAESLARRAIDLAPQTAILHYRLGLLRLGARDLGGAETSLLRAADLDPRQPEPLLALGDVACGRGLSARAHDLYERALALGGREAETRTALAAVDLDEGRSDDASREIEAALRAKPGDPEALLTRARLHAKLGEQDAARRDLLAAVTTGGGPYRARAMATPELRRLLYDDVKGGGMR
ncbi:MAG: tetratricopeptide repeat protein [Acidobacteria bacterium]|nr:tetratricopeptide repeat protein [Acidobacteriota bacterium]